MTPLCQFSVIMTSTTAYYKYKHMYVSVYINGNSSADFFDGKIILNR